MRGPGGGVGPAKNVAEDGLVEGAGSAQDGGDADAENQTSDDEEEIDTDGDDVHFALFCPQSVSHVQVHCSVDFMSTKIYFRVMTAGALEGMRKQNALQEDIDANEEGVVGHSSEPQPSTSGYVPQASATAQTKHQHKNSTSDSRKGNLSYESMVRKLEMFQLVRLVHQNVPS